MNPTGKNYQATSVGDIQARGRVTLSGRDVIHVGRPDAPWLGLAADIGTTKVAAYIVDLETGHTLAKRGAGGGRPSRPPGPHLEKRGAGRLGWSCGSCAGCRHGGRTRS